MKDKAAQHVCGKLKCDHCREMLLESERKNHCCKLNEIRFDKGYHRLGFFDIETFEVEEDRTLRDMLLHYSHES